VLTEATNLMTSLLLVPPAISLLLLGAHLLRWFGPLAVLPPILGIGLLLIPRRWAARVMQIILLLATIEWARTAVVIAIRRAQRGEPWGRAVIIVGAVTLFTLLSMLVFRTRPLRRFYRCVDESPATPS
jgi:hypothetical protein